MKNKSTLAFIRVFVVFTVIFIITEYFYKTGSEPAFIENPSVTLFMLIVLAMLLIFETFNAYVKDSDDKVEVEEATGLKGFLKNMWGAKPIEQEEDILLDHDFDGIKELDNALPPWWLYSFYASIIFAVLYLGYYHVLGGNTQEETFEENMETARVEVEKYKRENPSTFDLNASKPSDTEAGKKIYKTNCAACHSFDGGGGIGPNLTDEYWILGGGLKNVFNAISDGGRDGKGMIAWKNSLSPEKIQQVASYVLTLQGTTPEKPKDKEGELYKEE